MDAFAFVCQLFAGSILLMSGVIKLLDLPEFENTVRKYAVVPSGFERSTATAITMAELVAAVSLLSGELVRVGAGLAAALFLLFIGAVALNMKRGVELDCGCFGLLWREVTGWPTILRDSVLLAAALVVAVSGAGVMLREALSGPDGFLDLLPLVSTAALAALAGWVALAAHRANSGFEPPPPTPENLPPPDPA
jgi:uncharacterized membrane protein YphA (DoxX/SURF4 family)